MTLHIVFTTNTLERSAWLLWSCVAQISLLESHCKDPRVLTAVTYAPAQHSLWGWVGHVTQEETCPRVVCAQEPWLGWLCLGLGSTPLTPSCYRCQTCPDVSLSLPTAAPFPSPADLFSVLKSVSWRNEADVEKDGPHSCQGDPPRLVVYTCWAVLPAFLSIVTQPNGRKHGRHYISSRPLNSPPSTHHSLGLTLLFLPKFGEHELLSSDSEFQMRLQYKGMDGVVTSSWPTPWHLCLAHPWCTGVVLLNVEPRWGVDHSHVSVRLDHLIWAVPWGLCHLSSVWGSCFVFMFLLLLGLPIDLEPKTRNGLTHQGAPGCYTKWPLPPTSPISHHHTQLQILKFQGMLGQNPIIDRKTERVP